MLDKLERKFGRFALTNVTLYLVGGQVLGYVLCVGLPTLYPKLTLRSDLVLRGEVWRLLSFFAAPDSFADGHTVSRPGMFTLVFMFFFLYLLFLYGRSLEEYWGAFKYNVYLLVGWVCAVAVSFVLPGAAIPNTMLLASVFFAFAYLNPDFELLLFFILPVKIKWLALLAAAGLAYNAYVGGWAIRLLVVTGVLNFFLFFGRDIYLRVRGISRRAAKKQEARVAAHRATHTCEVCGLTDLDDPKMQFRYCSTCVGKRGYCMDHIKEHEHVRG